MFNNTIDLPNKINNTLISNDFIMQDYAGVKYLQSALLLDYKSDFSHAFSTRLGGFSQKPYDSFNLGFHEDFLIDDANQNRSQILTILNLDNNNLSTARQRHTDNIAIVSAPQIFDQTDSIIITKPNLPALMTFADCVPILVYDYKLKYLAVIHSGWRGTAKNILAKTIKKLINLGSESKHIIVSIGPAIDQCCFETGRDAFDQISQNCDYLDSSQYAFAKNDKFMINLKILNLYQALIFSVAQVNITHFCTSCHSDLFYSHRKFKGQTGRHALIAGLITR